MKKVTRVGNNSMIEEPMYMCSLDEFQRETTVEDGATLMVVDENADKVVKYCTSFNQRWRDL